MTKYRVSIRLSGLGLSQTNIALSCNASRTTVNKVLKAAKERNLSLPLDSKLTAPVLSKLLFPDSKEKPVTSKRMLDYDYIRKELLRNGVNKKLLWTEYLEECRLAGDSRLCTLSSVITSSRMNSSAVLPCISTANLRNRSKQTGLEIRRISQIQIPVRSWMPTFS